MSGLREVRLVLAVGTLLVLIVLATQGQWLAAGLMAIAVVVLGLRFAKDYGKTGAEPPPRRDLR